MPITSSKDFLEFQPLKGPLVAALEEELFAASFLAFSR